MSQSNGEKAGSPRFKLVISDCHLSAGRFFEGRANPYEDFKFDQELCDMLAYFSSGEFGEKNGIPVEVELFINGDFLDFLNVPFQGEFEEAITESLALFKLEAIIQGHPQVMAALKRFASLPGKRIRYLIGNHDADLFFPKIQQRITELWDPEGRYPSPRVEVIAYTDRVGIEGGIEIHHGNQFEAVHVLNFDQPILRSFLDEPVLNLPWGSFYVLKIINRLKGKREFIDKVRPVKVFVLFGLILDPWFTLQFVALSVFYFIQTRFFFSPKRRASWKTTAKIIQEETDFMLDLERPARRLLDSREDLKTVIFGHTHKPMHKIYPDGKQYLNTGTWTKMINLDWRSLGQQFCLTFAFIRLEDGGVAHCELRQWQGIQGPYKTFQS